MNTVMPYRTVDDAIELAKRGRGSLCGSLFTADDAVAREVVLGTAAYHGRLMLLNRHSAKESTGHGSPLPHLVHGGPGAPAAARRWAACAACLHYMQRTALQGPRRRSRASTQRVDARAPRRRPIACIRSGSTSTSCAIGDTLDHPRGAP